MKKLTILLLALIITGCVVTNADNAVVLPDTAPAAYVVREYRGNGPLVEAWDTQGVELPEYVENELDQHTLHLYRTPEYTDRIVYMDGEYSRIISYGLDTFTVALEQELMFDVDHFITTGAQVETEVLH